MRDGEADVVLGARSAVFAPLARLGLIVVDEEHDASYKQDATPRYDARQVAARRARAAGAAVVYGTATPRPETWRALPRHTLRARPDGSAPPAIEVVDMRLQGPGPVSRPLAAALHAAAVARREGDPAGQPARLLADGPLPRVRVDRPLPQLRRRPRPPRGAAPARLPPLRARGAGAGGVPVLRGGGRRAAGVGLPGPRGGPRPAGARPPAWCGWTARARPAAGRSAACWPSSRARARRSCSAPRWWPRATTCPRSPSPRRSTPTRRSSTRASARRSAPST